MHLAMTIPSESTSVTTDVFCNAHITRNGNATTACFDTGSGESFFLAPTLIFHLNTLCVFGGSASYPSAPDFVLFEGHANSTAGSQVRTVEGIALWDSAAVASHVVSPPPRWPLTFTMIRQPWRGTSLIIPLQAEGQSGGEAPYRFGH